MRYYKRTESGYIVLIGIGCGGEEITEQEYTEIMQAVRNKPKPTEGYDYKLREDLEWELCELPIVEDEEPATDRATDVF